MKSQNLEGQVQKQNTGNKERVTDMQRKQRWHEIWV
jgi:hypothetical protein